MKLSKKLIQRNCRRPLPIAKFLDISSIGLNVLKNLDECVVLHWLIAGGNKLQTDDGLENLKQLWYLDLSNNHITMLGALSRYLALGTLILTNNNLKWVDLEKIRHAHIMSISLHGNPCLDTDPYYRIHVIDCLPLIWELDGRLVTVTERLHVRHFFVDTELSQHPVRHKMGKTFRTSAIRNIGTEGIVSKQCKYIYSKFPMSETHTKHTDERRLAYLSQMVQNDIQQWSLQLEKGNPSRPTITGNFLDTLMEQRRKDVERSNMVLLLLVISLEYQLPTSLIRATLVSSHLDLIGSASIMPLFLLPPEHRTRVISTMLNAAKVERDNNAYHTGGLYPQLFMCLYYTVAQLTKISQTSTENMHTIKPIPMDSDYKALMASEVVSLMLSVNRFFTYLISDSGVLSLSLSATGDPQLVRQCQEKLRESESIFTVVPMKVTQKKVREIFMKGINERLDKISMKMSDIPIGDRYLALSDSLPIKPLHSVIWASEFLTNGQSVPKLDPPILNPAKEAAKPKPREPKIGDKILLGPQVVGDLTMILEKEIGMVKVDSVPLSNGAVQSKLMDSNAHYLYVDLQALCFAENINMWRSIHTSGDVHTIHSIYASQLMALTLKETFKSESQKPDHVIYAPKTGTMIVYDISAPKTSRSSSLAVEKRLIQALHKRASLGRSFDSNSSCAVIGGDLSVQENNSNQNAHDEDPADPGRDIICLHDDTRPVSSGEDNEKVIAETPRFTSELPVKTVAMSYAVPLPSRSGSPAQRGQDHDHQSQHDTEKEPNGDGVHMCESMKEHSEIEARADQDPQMQDVAGSIPANQESHEHDLECHINKNRFENLPGVDADQEKDDHLRAMNSDVTVLQSGQESGEKENLKATLMFPGLDKNNTGSVQDTAHNSSPVSDVQDLFLTSVNDQAEGLDSAESISKVESEVIDQRISGGAQSQTGITGDTDLNLNNFTKKQADLPKHSESSRIRLRCKSSHSARPGIGTSTSPVGRAARSAGADGSGGSSSKLVTFAGGSIVSKSNFQLQREDLWKSATKLGTPWQSAGVSLRSSSLCPPPQRPTSPVSRTSARIPRLKVTHTDTWLGGGRDLYWEDVKQRPKSGHAPGWKEGLPESMRRRRSKSAFVSSARTSKFGWSQSTISNISFQNLESASSDHMAVNDLEVTFLMPQTHQLLPHQPSSLCNTTSEDDPQILPLLNHR